MSGPSRTRAPLATRQLYFAYGSNLWLEQMAVRCPASTYIGRAVLPDYHWQINERGFANITSCSGSTVHGLVYELGGGDEARLDRCEGVGSGAYTKVRLTVILHATPGVMQLPTCQIVRVGGPASVIQSVWRYGGGKASVTEQPARLEAGVLVYLSKDYVRPGRPRDEYVDRINYGICDAVELGIPSDFFENAVRASIPDLQRARETRPPPASRSASRRRRRASMGAAPEYVSRWQNRDLGSLEGHEEAVSRLSRAPSPISRSPPFSVKSPW